MNQQPPHLWNDFVKSQPLGSLYQTSVWAHFQAKIPGKEKTLFVTIHNPTNEKEILGTGLIIVRSLPFGLAWVECPRGPVFRDDLTPEQMEFFFREFFASVKEMTQECTIAYIRIDPAITANSPLAAIYRDITHKLHLRPAHASYTPETTLIIDLTPSEEDILKQMKQKGRYNIKLAEKHGITIERIDTHTLRTDKTPLQQFHALITQTAQRDGFHVHDLAYYESMLEALGDSAALYLAYAPETPGTPRKPIAGLIATYFGETATYYYGASSYDDRHLMAPYLLQWHVMRDAKAQGYARYDLLGIATLDSSGIPNKSHPLAGVTDFKTKFGGNIAQYVPAKEYIYKPLAYIMVRFAKAWRHM